MAFRALAPLHQYLLAIAGFVACIGLVPLQAGAQTPDFYDLDTVRTIYLTFKQSNWWQLLEQNYSSSTDIEADMTVDSKTYPRVGVRFRGNTSYRRLPSGSQKKSFNITTDAFVLDQEVLGYHSLNLNNGFHDPTFTREVIMYQICRRYMCAPKANFVKLYLNNEFWGIYINVQQPNKDMMEEWFATNDGNRYRCAPPSTGQPHNNSALVWLGSNVQTYKLSYDFKQGDGTDLVHLIDVLNNTPTVNLQAALPKVYSVDQGLWYCIVMNCMLQTDSYIGSGKDHFLYHDQEHDTFHHFPFDVNECLGGEGQGNPTLSPFYNTTRSTKPVLSRTLQFPDWKARYVAHFRTVIEESFSWAELGGLVTKYQNMIAQDVAKDTKKIYTTAQFTENVTKDIRVGMSTIRGLKPLIEARQSYFNSYPDFQTTRPTLSDLNYHPTNPRSTQAIHVTVKASSAAKVTLYHRVKGPFIQATMYDDGQHGDGGANDGTYGAVVSPAPPPGGIVNYYVGASTSSGVMRFLPRNAEHKAPRFQVAWTQGTSPIRINEFVARNTSTIKDEMGEYEDWIELLNTGTTAVNLAGYHLTDKWENSQKWAIPQNTVIQPGKTLIIWADEDPNDGPLHASFKLSGSGESILLFEKDGQTLLDSVTFGPQQTDVSTGRMHGFVPVWATFPAPTPDSVNLPSPCGHLNYSVLDITSVPFGLNATGTPQVGGAAIYNVSGAPVSTPGYLILAFAPYQADFGALGGLLVNPSLMVALPIFTTASGTANQNIGIPNLPVLAGQSFYFQAFVYDGKAGGFSSGVVTRICP